MYYRLYLAPDASLHKGEHRQKGIALRISKDRIQTNKQKTQQQQQHMFSSPLGFSVPFVKY